MHSFTETTPGIRERPLGPQPGYPIDWVVALALDETRLFPPTLSTRDSLKHFASNSKKEYNG
jgi:hypothetical protein